MDRLHNNTGICIEAGILEGKNIRALNRSNIRRLVRMYPLPEVKALLIEEILYEFSVESLIYKSLHWRAKQILKSYGITRMFASILPPEILNTFKNILK